MPEAGDYKKLFIVGCPRSGTTWLQLLLAQHEGIATAPETQIFAYYLGQLERQWRLEHEGSDRLQGQAGLSRVLSDEEFAAMCRQSARMVLDKIRAGRPGSNVVVEKSPKHALHAAFIQQLFPDALFLNVVRDPRDTVASLIAASRSWGRDWAPPNAVQAARMWVDHIGGARRAAQHDPGRYHEVKYEQLKADPVDQLQAIFAWVGLEVERSGCEAAVAACDFEELKKRKSADDLPLPGSRSPQGFFRKGEAEAWRADLSPTDVRVVEHICGPLMAEFGYERSRKARRRPPFKILAHDGVQRVRESVDWQLARVLMKV